MSPETLLLLTARYLILAPIFCSGVRYRCGTIQFYVVRAPTSREYGWNVLYWQRSAIRHMLSDAKAHYAHVWWPEPLGICSHVWCDHLLQISRATKLRPPETGGQYGAVPTSSFLHHWVCATHVPWQSAVPCSLCPRTGSTNVRCQEYDGSMRSPARPIPNRRMHIPWSHVHERSGRTDAQRTDQELELFRRVDTKQH